MNKAELTEKFSQRLNDIENLKNSKDFYELEMLFDGIMKEMGNDLLSSLLESKSQDRRKKKLIKTIYGEVEVDKSLQVCQDLPSERTSPFLNEKLVYLGHLECYERSSQMAKILLGVEVSDSTIYRLTDKVGDKIKVIIDSPTTREEIVLEEAEILYVQVDGSMLLTREAGWKETKLGRVFKSSSLLPQSADRQWIRESEYVAHLGHHSEFEDLMSLLIDEPYRRSSNQIVFVGDGARWQWAWVEAEYPNAIQILDFYHAMEHIGGYLKEVTRTKDELNKLMRKIGGILKKKGIESTIRYLENIPRKTNKQKEQYEKLHTYISNNKTKMDYPDYISKNLIIGSGAIESAHRTVLQKRMKQSGQRWSKKGLTNMIKLRSASMSGYWNEIQSSIRKAA